MSTLLADGRSRILLSVNGDGSISFLRDGCFKELVVLSEFCSCWMRGLSSLCTAPFRGDGLIDGDAVDDEAWAFGGATASTSRFALVEGGGDTRLDIEERKAARCTRTRPGSAWSPASSLGRLLGCSDAISGVIEEAEAR